MEVSKGSITIDIRPEELKQMFAMIKKINNELDQHACKYMKLIARAKFYTEGEALSILSFYDDAIKKIDSLKEQYANLSGALMHCWIELLKTDQKLAMEILDTYQQ